MGSEDNGNEKALAIYHVMRAMDNFDDTADILFQLVKKAATEHPGKKRAIYLDIEGHRNKTGGFDADALELQQHFVVGFLGRWLSEVSMPLLRATTPGQQEDLPDSLVTILGPSAENRDAGLRARAQPMNTPIFDSATGEDVYPDGSRKKRA